MGSLKNMLLPAAYQGEGKKAPYFEGWYYKLQTRDGRIFACIPGISKSAADPHSFVQVIADGVSAYLRYPPEAFRWKPGQFEISVGGSSFSSCGFHLETNFLRGGVRLTDPVPFSKSRYGFGIMGPFALAPFLECRHGVVLARCGLSGALEYTGTGGSVSFDGGVGYLEKDWGSVFPNPYIWVHAFPEAGGSFMLSAARLPVPGGAMTGLAAFLYDGVRFRRFTTYGGARIGDIVCCGGSVRVTVETPRSRLALLLDTGETVSLLAPEQGGMRREIRESVRGNLAITLENRAGKTVFSGLCRNVSAELCGEITGLKRSAPKSR